MWTQSDIDALKRAIASGRLRVTMGDRTVTYRSLTEMRQILQMMAIEVNKAGLYRTLRVRPGAGL